MLGHTNKKKLGRKENNTNHTHDVQFSRGLFIAPAKNPAGHSSPFEFTPPGELSSNTANVEPFQCT